VTLLVILVAWFTAGVLATLVVGPRLRRAAELAGIALEPEPGSLVVRSPLRWRLGTLGVVGLMAGSTGMAAAGALPGSAQTIAHHVLGTVGVHVPEAPPPAQVVAGPGPSAGPSDGAAATPGPSGDAPVPETAGAPGPADAGAPPSTGVASTGDPETDTSTADPDDPGTTTTWGTTVPENETSDVHDGVVAGPPVTEPSDVPADEAAAPPETTTTTTPAGEPPPTDPGDDPPFSGSTTSTTSVPEPTTTVPAG